MEEPEFKWAGVVSEGSLHPEDLIPKFTHVLGDIAPSALAKLGPWPASPERQEYTVELIDMLDDAAPQGYYFGTHEGDGACFGFWKADELPDLREASK